ncbi:hypothetical protein [Streptomyces galbus]|uniref:Uncharacterized protein n=1 Tax=Streptomyces galbus TaxID=33898 RepID=A0ABX1IKV4_STRGB|nr:hypothetical protein [Streptomyces galbus]NKQ24827.1 hypothetical protein [Streptomyces galbus]
MTGTLAHFWHWLVIGVKLIDHPSQVSAYEAFRLLVFALFTVTLMWRIWKKAKLWVAARGASASRAE